MCLPGFSTSVCHELGQDWFRNQVIRGPAAEPSAGCKKMLIQREGVVRVLATLSLRFNVTRGCSHPPTISPKPVGTFRLGPHGVAVTVMVTFTGGSVDSCAGSEPGVVGDGSVPTENGHKQRKERCLGVSQVAPRGQGRLITMGDS